MYDCFNRKINYLRVSVTDRCNFRCTYCMPAEGIVQVGHKDILTFDEIVATIKYGVTKGIKKVRITGGEPLVRKGIVSLVEMISKIDGITDLAMTTNGALLNKYAKPLKNAGLKRVNISLDTLNPEKFKTITRIGELGDVLNGIDAARLAGLNPIKLNCVIKNSTDEKDAQEVKKFADKNKLQVRFIHEMNLETGYFKKVIGGEGGNCNLCNRLRLTATGSLKPCLFSEIDYNIREMGIENAYNKALTNKPKTGLKNKQDYFFNIGG